MIVVAGRREEPSMAVAYSQVQAASTWLANTDLAAKAAQKANLPWSLMCAVLDKESKGRSVFGHDEGGALSGYPEPPDESNFKVFLWLQTKAGGGFKSNGVGPGQLTWPGYFAEMEKAGLRPWVPADNLLKMAQILRALLSSIPPKKKSNVDRVWNVGKKYNGADKYADDLVRVWKMWVGRVGSSDFPSFHP